MDQWEVKKVMQQRTVKIQQLAFSTLHSRELKFKHQDSILEAKVEVGLSVEDSFGINGSKPLTMKDEWFSITYSWMPFGQAR